MSTRKSSLKMDSAYEFLQFRNKTIELPSRARLHTPLDQLQTTVNIKLDEKLTQKLIFVKKLQKLQKQAIKMYYQNRVGQCFESLQLCIRMLEDKQSYGDQNGVPEHWIYVRYLQCEFKYKAKQYTQARDYHSRALRIIHRLNKNQKQKTKEYIISLQAINCCLLFQEGKYTQCIKNVEEFEGRIEEGKYKVTEKYYKQVCLYRIEALLRIGEYQLVVKLVEKFQKVFRSFNSRDETKIKCNLAIAYKHLHETQKAQAIMMALLQKYQPKLRNNQSHMNSSCGDAELAPRTLIAKIYTTYLSLFAENPLKSLHIAHDWQRSNPYCDQSISKLFHLYFEIGDYETALTHYAQLSEGYKKTSEDWEVLGEIKEFYGEREMTEHMYGRAWELAKDGARKMGLQVKLLGFCKEDGLKEAMKAVEKKIKQNRFRPWIGEVATKYEEFLRAIGEHARIQKINKAVLLEGACQQSRQELVHQFLQTGKFGSTSFCKNQTLKNARKRNSLMIPKIL